VSPTALLKELQELVLNGIVDDSASDMSAEFNPQSPDMESDNQSISSAHSITSQGQGGATPRADRPDRERELYPSAATARRQKKEATSERQNQAQFPQRGSSLAGT
jgi:RalA-binding protein 1